MWAQQRRFNNSVGLKNQTIKCDDGGLLCGFMAVLEHEL
jgi:hypothetical protein